MGLLPLRAGAMSLVGARGVGAIGRGAVYISLRAGAASLHMAPTHPPTLPPAIDLAGMEGEGALGGGGGGVHLSALFPALCVSPSLPRTRPRTLPRVGGVVRVAHQRPRDVMHRRVCTESFDSVEGRWESWVAGDDSVESRGSLGVMGRWG